MTIAAPLTEAAFMARPCSIEGCERKHDSGGLCHMHRSRKVRTGTVGGPGLTEFQPPFQRVLSRIEFGPDGCWLWTGALTPKGYGHMNAGGGHTGTHRIVYEALRGPVPDGLVLDHLCRVTRCVNPDHLEVVTNRENVTRGKGENMAAFRAGTCRKGHPRSESYYKRNGSLGYCRPCRDARRSAT